MSLGGDISESVIDERRETRTGHVLHRFVETAGDQLFVLVHEAALGCVRYYHIEREGDSHYSLYKTR